MQVNETLRLVAHDMKTKMDVNKDGKINCIDAAVLFYQHFPDKTRVAIIRNYNPGKNFNHLFNTVKFEDGLWYTVEPQTFWMGLSIYTMINVWGTQYDSKFNTDETARWSAFVKY